MKKIFGIIIAVAIASAFVFAGCEKQQEAPKPAEQTAPTASAPTTSAPTSTAPAAPAGK